MMVGESAAEKATEGSGARAGADCISDSIGAINDRMRSSNAFLVEVVL